MRQDLQLEFAPSVGQTRPFPDVDTSERRVPGLADAPDVRVLLHLPSDAPRLLPGALYIPGRRRGMSWGGPMTRPPPPRRTAAKAAAQRIIPSNDDEGTATFLAELLGIEIPAQWPQWLALARLSQAPGVVGLTLLLVLVLALSPTAATA